MFIVEKFIRLLFQRHRQWLLYGMHSKNRTLYKDIYTTLRLAKTIDNTLLFNANVDVMRDVVVQTGLLNAEATLEWLSSVNYAIANKKPLEGGITSILMFTTEVTLDDFLVNNNGGSFNAALLHDKLEIELELLYTQLSDYNLKYRGHYLRRITLLISNITNILEGLLTVANK